VVDVRLIYANALKEWLGCDGDNKYRSMIMHEIADRIDEQPTIDAVPVVRCKDCVHYKPKDAMTPGNNRMRCDHPCLDYDIECYDQWLDVEPDDYCKHGKWKTDGGAEG